MIFGNVIDGKTVDPDVAQVLPYQVPLRDPVAGIHVPALVDDDVAVLDQGDVDIDIPDLLLAGGKGLGGQQGQGGKEQVGQEAHHHSIEGPNVRKKGRKPGGAFCIKGKKLVILHALTP